MAAHWQITLIRPPAVMTTSEVPMLMPPLGLAYVAGALMENEFPCTVIDAVGEALDCVHQAADKHYLIFGLSLPEILAKIPNDTQIFGVACAFTKEWEHLKYFLTQLKAAFPKVPIICGGEHITAVPEFSLSECPAIDYAVLGEGEETLVELVKAIEKKDELSTLAGIAYRVYGKVRINPRRARIKNVDAIARPAWSLFPLHNYFKHGKSFGVSNGPSMPILATRGCPYDCAFCSSGTMWQQHWIPRSPESIVAEIKDYHRIYGAVNFDFYDLTTIVRKTWLIELAQLIQKLDFALTWQLPSGTRSEAIDAEVCQQLYLANCRNLSFSPENAAPNVLQKMDKRLDPDKLLQAITLAIRHKIVTKSNFIFGFPGETHWDIWINLFYLARLSLLGAHDISIWSFAPYPGSKVFETLRVQGRIRNFNQDYLNSLTYGEMTQRISWNESMSIGWINFYRKLGNLMFYSLSIVLRPWRFVKLISNVIRGKYESRAEYMTAQYLKHKFTPKAKIGVKNA